MKSIIVLCFLSIFFSVLSATELEEKDLIWKGRTKTKIKRQAWPQNVQNDGQSPPVQPIVQPVVQPGVQPLVQPMRNTFCDHEISTIGKRSVPIPDSFPNLNIYYLNEESSDIKLVVNGTKLPAHRFVLMAKSPKFAEMFRSDPTKTEFDLGPDSAEVFKLLLKYFYTERFTLEDDGDYRKAIDVYKMAHHYGMDGLRVQIERQLAKMIFINNYLDIYKFAEENQMHELVRLWMTFVFANSQQIIGDESFMNDTVEMAQKVLGALSAPPSYVLTKIKALMEANPTLTAEHFRNIVYIERCNVEDLLVLAEMKLYDEKFLFEDMVKRFRILSANCQPVRLSARHTPRWVPNN